MAKYKCNACSHELQAAIPPFTCPQCQAKGKGFSKLSDAPAVAKEPKLPTPAKPAPAVPAATGKSTSLPVKPAGSLPSPAKDKGALPPPPGAIKVAPPPGVAPRVPTIPKTPQATPPAVKPAAAPPAAPTAGLRPAARQDTPPRVPTIPKTPPVAPTAKPVVVPQAPRAPAKPQATPVPPAALEPILLEPVVDPTQTIVLQAAAPATPSAGLRPAARQDTTPPAPPKPQRYMWSYNERAASGGAARPLRNCPAADARGRVFIAAQHKLAAFLEEPDGYRPLWEYATGGYIPGSPVVGPDGNIRVHSSDGLLHVVSPAGSAAFPPTPVGEPLGSAVPLVDARNNTWICAYHGGLLAVDAQGRAAEKPFFRTRQRFDCPGLIHADVLYVGAEDGCVYAISLEGSRGKNLWDHAADRGRTGWYINAAVALAGELAPASGRDTGGASGTETAIVVAGRDDCLHAFRLSGERLWSEPLGGQLLGSPIIDEEGAIYLGVSHAARGESQRGALVRVDGRTHKARPLYECPAVIESTPVLGDDGLIYFGDNSGRVYAVDRSGQLKWSESLGSPIRSCGAILGKGRLAFGLDEGSLVVLRCTSERLARKGWPKFLGTPEQSGSAVA